jgi:hypothetical protein
MFSIGGSIMKLAASLLGGVGIARVGFPVTRWLKLQELNCRKNLRWPLAEFIPIAFVRHHPLSAWVADFDRRFR